MLIQTAQKEKKAKKSIKEESSEEEGSSESSEEEEEEEEEDVPAVRYPFSFWTHFLVLVSIVRSFSVSFWKTSSFFRSFSVNAFD